MADTALTHDTGQGAASPRRRRPEAVAGEPAPPATAAEATTADEPDLGRTAMLGAALGFAVVTIAITVAGTIGGIGAIDSFGVGAFVGIWGGAGFGFMMGGTIPFALHVDSHPGGRSIDTPEVPHDARAR